MKLAKSIHEGFLFDCKQCGKCCSNETEGFVFLYMSDIENASRTLGLSKKEFAKKYLVLTDYEYTIWNEDLESTGETQTMKTLVLKSENTADCIFLTLKNGKKLCEIYESRPDQCKFFPFWSMLMTSEIDLLASKEFCKGFFNIPVEKKDECYCSPDKIMNTVLIERQIEYEYYLRMKECNFDIKCEYSFLEF
jgi:uncharacterized protein